VLSRPTSYDLHGERWIIFHSWASIMTTAWGGSVTMVSSSASPKPMDSRKQSISGAEATLTGSARVREVSSS
jgi:hypothetical protein